MPMSEKAGRNRPGGDCHHVIRVAFLKEDACLNQFPTASPDFRWKRRVEPNQVMRAGGFIRRDVVVRVHRPEEHGDQYLKSR